MFKSPLASLSPKLKRNFFLALSLILGVLLLYYTFRKVDFDVVVDALKEANYWWFALIFFVNLVSLWFRSYRWKLLLDALPDEDREPHGHPFQLKNSFYSMMIGYLINQALPRVGEVVRATNLAHQEKAKVSGVIGTVVVERIIDVLMLVLGLFASAYFAASRSDGFNQFVVVPIKAKIDQIGPLGIVLASAVGIALFYFFTKWIRSSENRVISKLRPLFESFLSGIQTAYTSPKRFAILWSTLAVWVSYVVMTYLPFHMLGQVEAYNLGLSAGLVMLCLGAVGFVIPSPGGIGSYHYIVMQGLILVYGFTEADASVFAILTHAGNMIFLSAGGFISLILQGSSLKAVTARGQEMEGETS